MLAYGYVGFSAGSGNSSTAAIDLVLLRDGKPRRCHGTIGASTWESAPTGYDSLLDGILQLGTNVEDTRDSAGDPATLPMRAIEIGDTVSDERVPKAFMVQYYKSEDADTQIEKFASVAMEAGTHSAAVDWDSDPDIPDLEPAVVADPDQTYRTPSGDPYLPRMVGGIVDVTVVCAGIDHGWTVGLAGEPGSGKTTLAQVAAPDLLQLTFHGETTVEDIVGRYNPDSTAPSGFAWVDGPLLQAMREGLPFLADELPRAPQEVQSVFLSVCDHRRTYIDTSNPNVGQVDAADGFAVLIAYNPSSGFGIPKALHDRIAFTITVPTDLSTAENLGVPRAFVDAARALMTANDVARAKSQEPVWVPSLRALLKARDIAPVLGTGFAARSLVSACPEPMLRGRVAQELEKQLGLGSGELGELVAES
ncbi:AAA family ATPase [Rhodococcus opacus]|uniref:AAA family ATPase n=1 Tax=Rhodococcus opacus TaxID=37919 RepID=A0AAX3YQ92_RHOOP|nr:AAA family ATPase [Rhodococcus opacus]MCZ4589613.1 AAA family ATPase [Rhodococcus opacus]WLF51228.1 AAA family ATPase [Rhodococcus opacus]